MSKQFEVDPICHENGKCFGQMYKRGGYRTCRILRETYAHDGQCPFRKKEVKDVRNSSSSGIAEKPD